MKRLGKWRWLSDRVGKAVAAAGVVGILGLGTAMLAPAVSAHNITSIVQNCVANPASVAVTVTDWSDIPPGNIEVTDLSDSTVVGEFAVTSADQTVNIPLSAIGGNGDYSFGREGYPTDPYPVDYTVDCASTTIGTTADPTATPVGVSETVGDSATLGDTNTGAQAPTGSIDFALYSDSGCTAAVAGVSGSGTISTSSPYTASYSTSWDPANAGTYYWQATYPGDANNDGVTSACTSETLAVDPVSETATTWASPSTATLDSSTQVSDTAFFPGDAPTGSVIFSLYSAADCPSGTPLLTTTGGIDPFITGYYSQGTSVPWTPLLAGTYDWIASYAGDGNNSGFTTSCGDPNEEITVAQATPSITTWLSQSRTKVDHWVTDTATLTGAAPVGADGDITISVFRGDNARACCGTAVWTENASPATDGDGRYSASFYLPYAGAYEFQASYAGDTNDTSATSTCGSEPLWVAKATPFIDTRLNPSTTTFGNSVTDTAYLHFASHHAHGAVIIKVYSGSSWTACFGTAVQTEVASPWVHGDGAYAATFSNLNPGNYEVKAFYTGDSSNDRASSRCGSEPLTINQDPTAITTQLTSGTATPGGSATDTATLSGASASANGSITISLYSGATAAACTGTPVKTLTASPSPTDGPGAYTATFTSLAAGSYELQATFAGDPDDTSATSTCGTELLTVSGPVGGQLAASTGTPVTGADLAGPGLVGLLAVLLGAVVLFAGFRLRRKGSIV
jgi:hypothetical protein